MQQGSYLVLRGACPHLAVIKSCLVVQRRVFVGVDGEATRLATERPLVWAIGTGHIMTARTFLRRIGGLTRPRPLPAFPSTPGELPGQMTQMRGTQVGIHALRLETHGPNRQVFVGHLITHMVGIELIDGAVDFLRHVPRQTVIGRRRELSDPLLLQACAEFGFPPPLLTVTLVPVCELTLKRSVPLPGASRQKARDPNIHANDGR